MTRSLVSSLRVLFLDPGARHLMPMSFGMLAGGCFRHAVTAGQQLFPCRAKDAQRGNEGRGWCAVRFHGRHQAWPNKGRHGGGVGVLAPWQMEHAQ